MGVLFYILIGLGGVWGILTLLGNLLSDKRCRGCGNYGDSEYMIKDEDGRYWHHSCFPLWARKKP